jgi:hypothetical protein
MGLDVSILPPESEEDILYMRNHDSFFAMMCSGGTEHVYEGYTDFFVDAWVLDRVEAALDARWPTIPADRTFTEAELGKLLGHGDEDLPAETLKPFYAKVIEMLRDALDEHGRLVCSWSA